jgi:hypothetical protein
MRGNSVSQRDTGSVCPSRARFTENVLRERHAVPLLMIQIPQSFGESDVNTFGLHVDACAKFRCERHEDFHATFPVAIFVTRRHSQQRNASGKFDVAHGRLNVVDTLKMKNGLAASTGR